MTRRTWVWLLLLGVLSLPLFGQEAYDHDSGAVGATVARLAAAKVVPSGMPAAKAALITIETASIRFWYDGTDPSTTDGHLVQAGDSFRVQGTNNVRLLRMIRATGVDAQFYASLER